MKSPASLLLLVWFVIAVAAACSDDSRPMPAGSACPQRSATPPSGPVATLPDVNVPVQSPQVTLAPGTHVAALKDVPYSFPTANVGRVSPPDQSEVEAGHIGPEFPLLVSFEMPFGSREGPPEVSAPRLCLDGLDISGSSTKNGHESAFDMYYEGSVSKGTHNAEVSYIDYQGDPVVYSWHFEAN